MFQRFRQRIIGFEERTYTRQPDGSYFYGVYPGTDPYPGYAIMGTGTAILHRAYLEMYFDRKVLPQGIFEYVNNNMNCEDLSMNVMVTNFLENVSWQQPAALAVKPIGQIQNLEGEACKYRDQEGVLPPPQPNFLQSSFGNNNTNLCSLHGRGMCHTYLQGSPLVQLYLL